MFRFLVQFAENPARFSFSARGSIGMSEVTQRSSLAIYRYCVRVHSLGFVYLSQPRKPVGETRIELQRFPVLLNRLVVLAQIEVRASDADARINAERIQFQRQLSFSQTRGLLTQRFEKIPMPQVGRFVARIEVDGSFEFCLSSRPVVSVESN